MGAMSDLDLELHERLEDRADRMLLVCERIIDRRSCEDYNGLRRATDEMYALIVSAGFKLDYDSLREEDSHDTP